MFDKEKMKKKHKVISKKNFIFVLFIYGIITRIDEFLLVLLDSGVRAWFILCFVFVYIFEEKKFDRSGLLSIFRYV